MSSVLDFAMRALEHRDRNTESVARRNAVFDIQTHDTRGDSLLDEMATQFAQQLGAVLNNFAAGDDNANGVMVRNVIFQVADAIHAKHPEDDDR